MPIGSKCLCGREIPVKVLWQVLAKGQNLVCSGCGHVVSADEIAAKVETGTAYEKIVVTIFFQLHRYGWTSAASLENAIEIDDSQTLGGIFSGLQRAGLITRAMSQAPTMVALFVNPKPTFVRGPMFPTL